METPSPSGTAAPFKVRASAAIPKPWVPAGVERSTVTEPTGAVRRTGETARMSATVSGVLALPLPSVSVYGRTSRDVRAISCKVLTEIAKSLVPKLEFVAPPQIWTRTRPSTIGSSGWFVRLAWLKLGLKETTGSGTVVS